MERFNSRYYVTKWIFFGIGVAGSFGFLENGWTQWTFYGVIIWLVGSFMFFIDDSNTYFLWDKTNRKLYVKYGFFSKLKEIPLHAIISIRRVQMFSIPHWGSRMNIEYQKDGEEKVLRVMEKPFSVKTIKKLFTEIHQITPNLDIDQQYLDLMGGKIASRDFSTLKATHRV